jgi:FkbM family methyltransferase
MLDKTNCDRFGKGKKFYVSETEIAGCSEMNKIRKLLEILYFAVSFGKNVRSRLFLFYLLLRPAFGKSKSNIEHVYQLYCQDKEYNLACKNYKNIPRHKIFNIALGKENTSANFLSDTKRAGGQCLEMHRPNADYFWERKQVSVRRAESLIEAQECDIPDMLKIDVEGGEYDVLTGFSEYLHYVREIMIEIHTTDLYEKCRSLVEQYGFRIYQEEKKGNTDVRFVCFVK